MKSPSRPSTLSPRCLRGTTGILTSLVLVLAATGCARVAPYERGTLARRDMAAEASGGEGLALGEEHAQAYREGSLGGGDAKGGGCGCN